MISPRLLCFEGVFPTGLHTSARGRVSAVSDLSSIRGCGVKFPLSELEKKWYHWFKIKHHTQMRPKKHAFDVCLLVLPAILLFILRARLCSQSLQQQRVIRIFFYSFDWGHLHAHEHILKQFLLAVSVFLDWFDNVRIGSCIDVQPSTYWHSQKHCSYVAQGWNSTIKLKKAKVEVSFAPSVHHEPTLTLTLLLRLKDTFFFSEVYLGFILQ